jgi:CubicO group peptidase (beta-lactamase class C family)
MDLVRAGVVFLGLAGCGSGTARIDSDVADSDTTEGDSDPGTDTDTDGEDSDRPDTGDSDPAWRLVGDALEAGVRDGELPGYQLVVRGEGGTTWFAQAGGSFTLDTAVPFDSAIKPVTGAVVLTAVRDRAVLLDDTLGSVLGWTGEPGSVRIRDLLTFTSGFLPDASCVPVPPRLVDGELTVPRDRISLVDCARQIRDAGVTSAPGTTFRYGATHQHLAAYVVETATGDSWEAAFDKGIRQPLGLRDEDIRYTNGRVAASAVGRARAMAAVFEALAEDGGLLDNTEAVPSLLPRPLAAGLFADDTRTNDVIVAESPWDVLGEDHHFGQGIWIDCARYDAPETCIWLGSGGNGTTVWIDPQGQYVAALVLYQGEYTGYQDGYAWMKRLTPLIRAAR